jgi:hypothetical protein
MIGVELYHSCPDGIQDNGKSDDVIISHQTLFNPDGLRLKMNYWMRKCNKWEMFEAFFSGRVNVGITNHYNVLLGEKGKLMRDVTSFKKANLKEAESNTSDGIIMWEKEDFDFG